MSAASLPTRENQLEATNLVRAAEAGDSGSVEVLLAAGADINATTRHGMTALMSAAANGHLKLVSLLLERGADLEAKRIDSLNALALAVFFGHVHVVRELLARGADIKAKSRFGTSPELWATARGFHEITKILTDAKTVNSRESLEKRDNDGTTSLTELEEARDLSFQEISSAEEVEAVQIPVQSLVDSRHDDEWSIDSLDSSEQTLEMSPAYVWNVADEDDGKGDVSGTDLGTRAELPVASLPEKNADTFVPVRTERPRALPAANQPSQVYNAPVALAATYSQHKPYPKLVPFLVHITSDWRRLTIATLVVMLACGVGTLAFLQLLRLSAARQAATPAHSLAEPSATDAKDSAALPEEFSSAKSVEGTASTTALNNIPSKKSLDSTGKSGTRIDRTNVARVERARKPTTEEEFLRKPTERTTKPKSRQSITHKQEAQVARGRTDSFSLADVAAKRSPSQGEPATAAEKPAKVQPPSTPAPLSIEVQRPRTVSARSDSPATAGPAPGSNSKTKVIRWP